MKHLEERSTSEWMASDLYRASNIKANRSVETLEQQTLLAGTPQKWMPAKIEPGAL